MIGVEVDSIGGGAAEAPQREIPFWRYPRLHFYSLAGLKVLFSC